MSQVAEKRIAITGAASGLGRALALQFARQGWRVAIGDLNEGRGLETVKAVQSLGVDAFFQHLDVRDMHSLEAWRDAIISRWQGLDLIINNAGVATHGAIDVSSIEDWNWIVDINLMGVVRACQIFTKVFKNQGHGYIINIASMAGLGHIPEMGGYNVTKAGVVALSETLKVELQPSHIGVSVVCPGFFPTNLSESIRSSNPQIKQAISKAFSKSKLSADDVARYTYDKFMSKTFYILPHRNFALFWYLKRLSPPIYFWLLAKNWKKELGVSGLLETKSK
ncbi:MAG: SDR family oxidoreductase [Proteobacteria bacterium]|nr:SDR family oxidoreductase [Pseudomonadota bacterium]